jgi:hypothetical protein
MVSNLRAEYDMINPGMSYEAWLEKELEHASSVGAKALAMLVAFEGNYHKSFNHEAIERVIHPKSGDFGIVAAGWGTALISRVGNLIDINRSNGDFTIRALDGQLVNWSSAKFVPLIWE